MDEEEKQRKKRIERIETCPRLAWDMEFLTDWEKEQYGLKEAKDES